MFEGPLTSAGKVRPLKEMLKGLGRVVFLGRRRHCTFAGMHRSQTCRDFFVHMCSRLYGGGNGWHPNRGVTVSEPPWH